MAEVRVNGYQITAESQQEGGHQFSEDARHSEFLLIQFRNSLEPSTLADLKSHHVRVFHFVGNNTYICRYPPANLADIRELPYVEYANVYHNDNVIDGSLTEWLSTAEPGTEDKYLIQVHDESPESITATKEKIAELVNMDKDKIEYAGWDCLTASLTSEQVFKIAKIDNIQRVERTIQDILSNHHATRVLKARWQDQHTTALAGATPPIVPQGRVIAPGVLAFEKNDFKAKDEVIACIDSGFDLGDYGKWLPNANDNPNKINIGTKVTPTEVAPEFRPLPGQTMDRRHPAFGDRVCKYIATGDRNGGNACFDNSGHGTHVAGSICGNFWSFGAGYGRIEAPASRANLMVIATNAANAPESVNLTGITWKMQNYMKFQHPVTARRPRVFNLSTGTEWHAPIRGEYTAEAGHFDQLVHTCQDTVIVVSAGNHGLQPANSPNKTRQGMKYHNAKNIIVVGGCENDTTVGDIGQYRRIGFRPLVLGGSNGNINRVGAYSSRGPTAAGLQRPDVVAPGSVVYSSKTRSKVKPQNGYGDSPDKDGCFKSGTSMAAPVVAGCCASIRSVYLKIHGYFPSAAMVKALLIIGAVDLFIGDQNPAHNGGPAPNNVQGYGRVNLRRSLRVITDTVHAGLDDSRKYYADQRATQDNDAASHTSVPKSYDARPLKASRKLIEYTAQIPQGQTGTLTVCLAYTDMYSKGGVQDGSLCNEVSLQVSHVGAGGLRQPPLGSGTARKLIWENAPAGVYKIRVRCDNFVVHPTTNKQVQHYAICWMIDN